MQINKTTDHRITKLKPNRKAKQTSYAAYLRDMLEYVELPWLADWDRTKFGVLLDSNEQSVSLPFRSRGWILNLHQLGHRNLETKYAGSIYWVGLAHPDMIGVRPEGNQPLFGAWWSSKEEIVIQWDGFVEVYRPGSTVQREDRNERLHLAVAVLAARVIGVPSEDVQIWLSRNQFDHN
ncbi:MAG: hypothetical protein AAF558_07795 [Verrucomicrobiota bacterium]